MLRARELADRIDLTNGAKTCTFNPDGVFSIHNMATKGESKTSPNAELVTAVYDACPKAADPVSVVDHEEIARIAYYHWDARGCPIGSPEEDWYRAENELRQPITVAAAA